MQSQDLSIECLLCLQRWDRLEVSSTQKIPSSKSERKKKEPKKEESKELAMEEEEEST